MKAYGDFWDMVFIYFSQKNLKKHKIHTKIPRFPRIVKIVVLAWDKKSLKIICFYVFVYFSEKHFFYKIYKYFMTQLG